MRSHHIFSYVNYHQQLVPAGSISFHRKDNQLNTSIRFTSIDYSSDGTISCEVQREDVQQLWIRLPYEAFVSPDVIALALATLCGTTFDSISLDLPVGPTAHAQIEKHTRATLHAPEGKDRSHRPGTETALNFSGGFDSLAALAVLENPLLISLDFGGRFSRERSYFKQFDTHIIETNIVDTGMNSYSWQFMGIGSILMRQELNLGHYAFGSIMAGSMPRLLRAPADQYTTGLWSNNMLAMKRLNPVAGVSEIGTLGIVTSLYPHAVLDSLESVANPQEDKYLRKLQMLTAVCDERNIPIRLPNATTRTSRRKWGDSQATDISSIYVMSQIGVESVYESYAQGIPKTVVDAIPNLDLDFYKRINPHAYANIPKSIRSDIYERLISLGLKPFERKDWSAADDVINLLSSDK